MPGGKRGTVLELKFCGAWWYYRRLLLACASKIESAPSWRAGCAVEVHPITHIRLFKGACQEEKAGCRWADGGLTLMRVRVRMSATMRQMLEAGVHFGHQTSFWNPKMAPYIFGARSKIHIVNLEKTLAKYNEAMSFVRKLSANKGTILFVGTKRQSREIIAEEATRCDSPYRRPALARAAC
jgi:hypothetical protein